MDFKYTIPIEKIDKEKRLIFGRATEEILDKQKDIVGYDGSLEAFKKWIPIGNIREMHQAIAVGKAVEFIPDDENKAIWLKAHISKGAEDTWLKVQDKTLSMFSIGGSNVKRITKKVNGEDIGFITSYDLNEVSLVDSGACPVASFSVVKCNKLTKSIYDASMLINMARDLRYMISESKQKGKDTDKLKEIYRSLKQQAIGELKNKDDEDSMKMLKQINELDKIPIDGERKENSMDQKDILKIKEELRKEIDDLIQDTFGKSLKSIEDKIAKLSEGKTQTTKIDASSTINDEIVKLVKSDIEKLTKTLTDKVDSIKSEVDKSTEDIIKRLKVVEDVAQKVKTKASFILVKSFGEDMSGDELTKQLDGVNKELDDLKKIREGNPDTYVKERMSIKAFRLHDLKKQIEVAIGSKQA